MKKSSELKIEAQAIISVQINGFVLKLFDSISQIEKEWKEASPELLFFSVPFLALIEDHPPAGLKPFYGIFYKDNQPAGICILQVKRINLYDSMKFDEPKGGASWWTRFSLSIKKFLSRSISFDTLVCGNILLTGEYGYYFKSSLNVEEQWQIIEKSLPAVIKGLKKFNYRIGPTLMKDFYDDKSFKNRNSNQSKFTEFAVQPNMIMDISRDWNSIDDYLSEIKSKYRVRVRRAFKKQEGIVKRELFKEDILHLNDQIYELYLNTARKAGFNLFLLPQKYFYYLKEYLEDSAKIVGYFIDGELIGYYTIVYNQEFMEAHYLGYNKQKNAQYQTYLNMLFDLVKEGIACNAPKIQFARTALEIKSSVGAKPYDMNVYLTHRRKLINALLPGLLKWFVPQEKWIERYPYK